MVLFNSCVRPPAALRAAVTITHILSFSLECLQSAGQVLKRTTLSLKKIRIPSCVSSAPGRARACGMVTPRGRGTAAAGRPAGASPVARRAVPHCAPQAPPKLPSPQNGEELQFQIRLSPNASFFPRSSDIERSGCISVQARGRRTGGQEEMTLLALQPQAQALRGWPSLPAQGRDAASPGPAPARLPARLRHPDSGAGTRPTLAEAEMVGMTDGSCRTETGLGETPKEAEGSSTAWARSGLGWGQADTAPPHGTYRPGKGTDRGPRPAWSQQGQQGPASRVPAAPWREEPNSRQAQTSSWGSSGTGSYSKS